MSLKVIFGDLLQLANSGHFDVIVHGCNCHNTMGAGIALQIKNKYPQAYEADLKTIKSDKNKLGNYTYAIAKNNAAVPGDFVIVNAYTQYNYNQSQYGSDEVLLDYHALQNVLEQIAQDFNGYKIGFPLIGCGLAGGDEKRVVSMITKELGNQDITIVKFDK